MEKDRVVHSFGGGGVFSKGSFIIFIVLIIVGIGTGYVLASGKGGVAGPKAVVNSTTEGGIEKGKIYGSTDEKTFKDTAEGMLKPGGIEGEGAFHLERPGGESQNVYMTSSTIDLSQFVNKKVKVWGQTNSAKSAGWLMDVGRLQVL